MQENYTSKSGYQGSLLCVKLEGRDKPLFRFVSDGKRAEKRLAQFGKLESGDEIELTQTAYGEWYL